MKKRPPAMEAKDVIPIPIRDGLTVSILGLPLDLTRKEAAKISAVILAFAGDEVVS